MNEVWNSDSLAIAKELEIISRKGLPVSLQSEARHIAISRLRTITNRNGTNWLVFYKPDSIDATSITLVDHVVYKFENRPFIYFPALISRVHAGLMACHLPSKLFFLQRRRYSRFFIKNQGVAAFFVANRPKVCRMYLEDISMGGARLTGIPHYDLNLWEQIGPATFSIIAQENNVVKELTISQASIVRNFIQKQDSLELGLRFSLSQVEKGSLARLLTDPYGSQLFHWHKGTE